MSMTNLRIKLKCECCNKVHDLPRTEEIPENVNSLACNFCCECQDKMTDYYYEWYVSDDEIPEPINPNQLTIF